MRNQRAGQATFIPLDTIQVKPINDKLRTFAKGGLSHGRNSQKRGPRLHQQRMQTDGHAREV